MREILTLAINEGQCKNQQLEARMKDVESAIKMVKEELISKLPKQRRSGRLVTKNLQVNVLPVIEEAVA